MIMPSGGSDSRDANVNTQTGGKSDSRPDEKLLDEILLALKGLQFGEVLITVRDGRVVQIDRVARNRQILSRKPPSDCQS